MRGLPETLLYLLFSAVLPRLGFTMATVLRVPDEQQSKHQTLDDAQVIGQLSELTLADTAALRGYGGEDLVRNFEQALQAGERCAIERDHGNVASTLFIRPVDRFGPVAARPSVMLWRGFTLPDHRGRGLFPHTIAAAVAYACAHYPGRPIFALVSLFNRSSLRSFIKTGFEPTGTLITFWRWKRVIGH